jgi:hypothetical protein
VFDPPSPHIDMMNRSVHIAGSLIDLGSITDVSASVSTMPQTVPNLMYSYINQQHDVTSLRFVAARFMKTRFSFIFEKSIAAQASGLAQR